MRIIWGIILGLALFFPGIELVRWLGEEKLGYEEMSVTDGCLVMLIILLSVIIVSGLSRRDQARPSRREPASPGPETQPYPQDELERGVRRPIRRSSSRRTVRR